MYQPNDTSLGPKNWFLPPANKVCEGYVFTRVCNSVHRGGRVWLLQEGHAWLLGGGVVARGGACMVALGGHAWLLWGVACMVARGACVVAWGVCMVACGGWHAWLLPGGARGCSRGDVHGIRWDTEIRSMSGRYASYWNAFFWSLRCD